ncbi:hypothetical protein SO802_013579 [Lithocarpus litseifolius]|uniref:Uncharacterized protein n=1 Tax=Lithocarpus litseifolius TaxID=425828 RepID=A0AAW2D5Z6_9ROSI
MNVLLFLFLVAIVVRATSQPPNPTPLRGLPYDYYFVVLHWPKSVCNTSRYQCTKPIPAYFTLHGLWPQRNNVQCLVDCTLNQIPDDHSNVLTQYWPNLYGDNITFWMWEYNKHGSCFKPFYQYQTDYFVSTFTVPLSTNLSGILSAVGIISGSPTIVGAIQTAIQTSTRFWPTMQCNRNLVGTLQLYQIYLFFNKTTMMQINCTKTQKGCTNPIDYT